MNLQHKEMEQKWQQYWEENKTFKTDAKTKEKSFMHWICFHIHQGQVFT